MELREAIIERRSIRKYKNTPVAKEVIAELLENACWAPSGLNRQPWYFMVFQSGEKKPELRAIMSLASERARQELTAAFPNKQELANEAGTFIATLGGAPVYILVFLLEEYGELTGSMTQSAAAAIQNFCLLAYEKGLATCWLTATDRVKKEIAEQFGKGKGPCVAMLTVGYADQVPVKPKRKPERYVFI